MKFASAIVLLAFVASACSVCTLQPTDANTLSYALTLEHLEAAFYAGINTTTTINQAAFNAAGFPATVYPYIEMIRDHEDTHVATLTSVLSNSGCNVIPACAYNFAAAYASPATFISTALALESVGVAAYNGAINTIFDPTLRQVAATIATVEARHTAYLATLNISSPFPTDFDAAFNSSYVYSLASAFLQDPTACAASGALPALFAPVQPNYTGVYNLIYPASSPLYNIGNSVAAGTCGIVVGDLVTVNYALALEHLEAQFYVDALNNTALVASLNNATGNNLTLSYFQMIRDHELAHVAYLVAVHNATNCNIGNYPVPPCVYNFTPAFVDVATFIATAYTLESTGVSAYDGAINTIRDAFIRQAAATIATVEARHTAVLATLAGINPFPSAFDTPLNTTEVLTAVTQTGFIVSCPVAPAGPQSGPVALNQVTGTTVAQTTATPTTAVGTTASRTTAVGTTAVASTTATTGLTTASTTRVQTTGVQTTATRTTGATTSASSQVVASFVLALVAVLALVL